MSANESLAKKAIALWEDIKTRNPQGLALNTGAEYLEDGNGEGWFSVVYWGKEIKARFPAWSVVNGETGKPAGAFIEAIIAYYFYTSDGSPLANEWIAFTELPDGKFYTKAFQGYSGRELTVAFGNDLDTFSSAAVSAGGISKTGIGDRGFAFKILPKVSLMVVVWEGDEDFSPSYRILFDKHAGRHLTTDALAILGSQLTGKLLKGSAK